MNKLILKDKTEIELNSYYGETYTTIIDNYAYLDNLKNKLSDVNTSIMTLKNDNNEKMLTGLKLQAINTNFIRDSSGNVIQIYAILMFKQLDRVEQLREEFGNRIDTLSDMVAELSKVEE